jgi:hypothetical protein
MWKKLLLAVTLAVTAPFALVGCSASGSGTVSPDDDASSTSKSGSDDGSSTSSTRTR